MQTIKPHTYRPSYARMRKSFYIMFLSRFFNSDAGKIKNFMPFVEKINALEENIRAFSGEALRGKTEEFRKRLQNGETLDDILPEAFACVREAARRTLGQRHYDVQLLGGIALHKGNIAEMKTGEGKTLASTLSAYLNALSGRGVHVVTVNDYLARRDTVWMGQIYYALGLSIGCINGGESSYLYDPEHRGGVNLESHVTDNKQIQDPNDQDSKLDKIRDTEGAFKVVHEYLKSCPKKEAYAADITYGTNNEFGFDYLRDNIAYAKDGLAQRDYHYAIVDEIDSILIDEARTPLIISAQAEESESLYHTFARVAAALKENDDFSIDEKLRAIQLSDDGITKAEKMLGIENIYTEKGIKYVHHLENAVRAKALFHKDKEYVIRDGGIIIVDEFTGRLQPGRRWSEGLHQAIEAKEGLKVERESRTIASITFQNYFRLYKKISGMTGTAATSAEEFQRVYNLDVIAIPPNKPVIREDHDDLIFQTEKGKFQAVARTVQELHARGQPVLIGTVSIEKNEALSAYLTKEGITHELLNAKNHEREGEVIAQAGRLGAVTIATNMAVRGVDILLGGNPQNSEEAKKVRELGGLFVIGTERHEARRIDNQLRGRSGRQGDPGSSQFFVSMEDTLMRVFASETMKSMMGRFGIPEDQAVQNRLVTKALETAQTKIEGFNFDARKHVLAFDDILNQQRTSIYTLRRSILRGEGARVEEFLNDMTTALPATKELIEKKKEELGKEKFLYVASLVILKSVDIHWMEHLETMDHLRQSVNLRAYGQRDPLVEYKKEGLRLFKEMKESLYYHIEQLFATLGAGAEKALEEKPKKEALQYGGGNKDGETKKMPIRGSGAQVGRNDPCPCGSGKKYKKCHGS